MKNVEYSLQETINIEQQEMDGKVERKGNKRRVIDRTQKPQFVDPTNVPVTSGFY